MIRNIIFAVIVLSLTSLGVKAQWTSFYTKQNDVMSICLTGNGDAVAIADFNTVKVYLVDNPSFLLNEFETGHSDQIMALDIAVDSTIMVTGSRDGSIVVYDFIGNKILKTLNYHHGIVSSVKLTPDNRYLVSGGTDNDVYVYDLQNDKIRYIFSDHTGDVTSIDVSLGRDLIATASEDQTINIYSLMDGTHLDSLVAHKDWVRDISFTPEGTDLLSCGDDNSIIKWNIYNLNNITYVENRRLGFDWLLCLDYFDDGITYATGDNNGKIVIKSAFKTYTVRLGVPVNDILFVPDDLQRLILIVATSGKGVKLLNLIDMKSRRR